MLEIQSYIAEHLDDYSMVLVYSTDPTAVFDLLRPAIFFRDIQVASFKVFQQTPKLLESIENSEKIVL